jgi:hypothetical protein
MTALKNLETMADENQWDELTAAERAIVRRESRELAGPEISELETGRRLVAVRQALERAGGFARFLDTLPFTYRTAYRRIKAYERACEMWPKEMVEAAIARRLKIVGASNEKPMGLYEDIRIDGKPPKNLAQYIDFADYLSREEIRVLRHSKPSTRGLSAYETLKLCFRFVDKNTRSLPPKERRSFLSDLVGLEMTLLGATTPQEFDPAEIPPEFWQGGRQSPETRARIARSTSERWKRIKQSKQK